MAGTPAKKRNPYGFLIRFLVKTLAIATVIAVVLIWILALYRMTGNSMFPSVRDGDLCVFYKLGPCTANEVILYEDAAGTLRTGRIVATGGQTVDFPEQGGFTVNGIQPLEEIPYETYAAQDSAVTWPLTLAEDEVFVLNDFRADTRDSRESGAVPVSRIRGKLLVLLRRRGF